LVLRNYHLETPGQSKFRAKLGLEKEEKPPILQESSTIQLKNEEKKLSSTQNSLINGMAKEFNRDGKEKITQEDVKLLLNKKPNTIRKNIQNRIDDVKKVLGETGFLSRINQEIIRLKNLPPPEKKKEIIFENVNIFENKKINSNELLPNTEKARLEVERLIYPWIRDALPNLMKNKSTEDKRPTSAFVMDVLNSNSQSGVWDKLSLEGQKYLISLCDPEKKKEIIFENVNISQTEKRNPIEHNTDIEDRCPNIKRALLDNKMDSKDIRKFIQIVIRSMKEEIKKDDRRQYYDTEEDYITMIAKGVLPQELGKKYIYIDVSNLVNELARLYLSGSLENDDIKEVIPYAQKPLIDRLPQDVNEQKRPEIVLSGKKFRRYNVSGLGQNCGLNVQDIPRGVAQKNENVIKKLTEYGYLNNLTRGLPIQGQAVCIIGQYVLGANIVVYAEDENGREIPGTSSEALGISEYDLPTLYVYHANGHYQILVPAEDNEENNLLRAYGRVKEDLNKNLPENIPYNMQEINKLISTQFLNNGNGGWLKSYVDWVKYKRYEDSQKKTN
jgi:hypothetical protein